jgi:uncharacterized protein DUF6636
MGTPKPPSLVRIALAGALLATAAGCMGSGSKTTVTATTTVSAGQSTTSTSTEPPSGSTDTTTVIRASGGVPDRLASLCGKRPCDDFATPSGNIKCFAAAYGGGSVECLIETGLVPVPTSPPCDLDRNGLVVGASGSATPSCRGDPTPAVLDKQIPALPYDAVWVGFGVHCLSQTSGLTCVNGEGHGFFLARERWTLF